MGHRLRVVERQKERKKNNEGQRLMYQLIKIVKLDSDKNPHTI